MQSSLVRAVHGLNRPIRPVCAGGTPACVRQRPERTLPYQLIEEQLPELSILPAALGSEVPSFVEQEFDARTARGRLDRGFPRVWRKPVGMVCRVQSAGKPVSPCTRAWPLDARCRRRAHVRAPRNLNRECTHRSRRLTGHLAVEIPWRRALRACRPGGWAPRRPRCAPWPGPGNAPDPSSPPSSHKACRPLARPACRQKRPAPVLSGG